MKFLDLKTQQKRIRKSLEKRISKILDHGAYIMGLIERLNSNNIPSVTYCKNLMHFIKAFSCLGSGVGYLPVSESLSNLILSLPIHPYSSEEDVEFIIDSFQKTA